MSEKQYQVGDKVNWQGRDAVILSVNDDKDIYRRPPYTIEFDMLGAKGLTNVFARHIEPIEDGKNREEL